MQSSFNLTLPENLQRRLQALDPNSQHLRPREAGAHTKLPELFGEE